MQERAPPLANPNVMNKPKVICVVGARPQFVKHSPILAAFREHFVALTAHTCQHYDHNMSQVFFDELNIPTPEFILEETSQKIGQGQQTASMLAALETLFVEERPDAVLVYGDTNSTLAGALAASKLHIPILHVEAGLRSFNREMPEEVNRVLTDHVSSLLFAPTQTAVANLGNEGITKGVHLVGDVMIDAVKQTLPKLKAKRDGTYYFATLHRPYNVDDPERLKLILNSLNAAPAPVVLPLHPRTRKSMERYGMERNDFPNLEFVAPVGYVDCLAYQAFSRCVITDSGGIQKEAYALKKPCLTVRFETEWVETLEGGCNRLVGDDPTRILEYLQGLADPVFGEPYGAGDSAQTMAKIAHQSLTDS